MTDPPARALRQFWFPGEDGISIGVTAWSREDAIALLAEVQARCPIEPVDLDVVVEDVDVFTLDPVRVLSNVGDRTRRGVWFPRIAAEPDEARCPDCDFRLAGTLREGLRRCPECGGGFELSRLRAEYEWDRAMLTFSVIALSVAVVLVLILIVLVLFT